MGLSLLFGEISILFGISFCYLVACNESTNDELAAHVTSLAEKYDRLNDVVFEHQLEIDLLKKENQYLKTQVQKMNQHFAFSVYAADFAEYESGDVIQFTGVVSNIGAYYDVTTSTFTCPSAGTYYFAINMQSMTNGYMVRAEMVKDDVMIANAEIYDVSTYEHMSSNSAIVTCLQGEKVWVRAGARSEVHGENQPYTTFMGFLIEMNI